MRWQTFIYLIIGFLIFFPLLFIIVPDARAQEIGEGILEQCESFAEPVTYKVGYILVDVGEINLETGTYELTFWVLVSSDQVDLIEHPLNITWVNGKNIRTSNEVSTPKFYYIRIDGTFFNNMDFRNHPFTDLVLKIEIEPLRCSSEFVRLEIDDSFNYADSELYIPGWDLRKIVVEEFDHFYPAIGEFSRVKLSINVATPILSSFLKLIVPIIMILFLLFLTLLVEPDRYIDKLRFVSVLLLATLFYSLSLLRDLPALAHLTLQDKIFVVVYVLLFYVAIDTFVQRSAGEEGTKDAIMGKIRKIMRYSLPFVVIVPIIILWQL